MFAGITRAAVVAVTASALTGCAATEEPEGAEPVSLTLTTYDAEDTPGGALVQHFVDEVERLDPSITIIAHYEQAPHEPDAVTAVSDGSADLAMVASRAFDTAGVTTLQALNTPLLINSNALANAVATSRHTSELLAGLEDIGVVGLAIAPEGMRHLFGDDHAPVDVGDLQGATVRSPQSQVVWSLLAEAGATPIFDDTRDYDMAESQYDQSPLSHAAGNLTLFPKYDVISINGKTAHELSPTQMDALRDAAAQSTAWAVANVQSDGAMASAFCANGGQIAAVTPPQLKEWLRIAEPVIEELRSVPSTADLIDDITEMKSGIDAGQPITGCDQSADSTEPKVSSRLNGTYVYTATVEAFRKVGVHNQDFINMNAGDYTVTMKNGELNSVHRYTSGPQAGQKESGIHSYALDGDTLTFRWSTQPLDFTEVKVTVLPDGSLEFSDWVEGLPEPKFLLQDKVTLRHWERVK